MTRLAKACALWLLAGVAVATEPAVPPRGFLEVDDPGCADTADDPGTTRWENGQRAIHSQTLWMSSQEAIDPGPVEIDVTGRWVAAWVTVREIGFGTPSQVPACVRPVTLRLQVEPLPEDQYEWVFRRGSRAEDEADYRKALDAVRAEADAAPQATTEGG